MSNISASAKPVVAPACRPVCESCRQQAATIQIHWADGHRFEVCAGCTPVDLVELDHAHRVDAG